MSAFTEANRKAFDDLSSEYDSKPWRLRVSQQISDGLEERKDWIGLRQAQDDDLKFGRETRLLDFACGTGSITKALGPWVTHIRGIDISENMVAKFNEAAHSSGLPFERAHAVAGDLLADEVASNLQTDDLYNFDIAIIGLGFHHFENPARALERLAQRLKPTGILLIIDFLPFDAAQGTPSAVQATIKHRGFARANMEKLYGLAKLTDFGFEVLPRPAVMEDREGNESQRSIFFARGRRPNTAWGRWVDWLGSTQHAFSDQWRVEPRAPVPKEQNQMGGKMREMNAWENDFAGLKAAQQQSGKGEDGSDPGKRQGHRETTWKMV